jgi:hypothetical protein
MTHPMILLRDGIKEALLLNGNLAAKVNERIYHYDSPPGTLVPWVEYRFTAGGFVNQAKRDHIEVIYEVYGVATDDTDALEIAQAIHNTLTGRGVPMGGTWDNYATLAGDWAIEQFYILGQEYVKAGEMFEFRAARRG